MISLPAAQFMMGSLHGDADETPVHTVIFRNGIKMGKYEITNAEVASVYTWGLMNKKIEAYPESVMRTIADNKTDGDQWELIDIDYPGCKLFLDNGVLSVVPGFEEYPCTLITWYGAVLFCNLLSEMKGLEPVYDMSDISCDWGNNGYRLPTEAEWEFAARGGTKSRNFTYSGSNNPDEVAWYGDNADQSTHPVGLKTPNEAGFHDMSGNVWECCWDLYGYYIPGSIEKNAFENDLLKRIKNPDDKEYIQRVYSFNQENQEYELIDEFTNEECRRNWELFRAIGYKMDKRIDPKGIIYRNKRVLRGGDWGSKAFYLRTTYRGRVFAQVSSTGYGFRIVQLNKE